MRLLTISLLVLAFLAVGCVSPAPHNDVSVPHDDSPSDHPPAKASVIVDNVSAIIASGNASVVTGPPIGKGDESIAPLDANVSNQSAGTSNQSAGSNAPIPKGIPFGENYLLVLDDISVSGNPSPCGIFSVRYAANSSIISNLMVCQGESGYWTSPENHRYRILVVKAAAGYTEASKWADVRIFG